MVHAVSGLEGQWSQLVRAIGRWSDGVVDEVSGGRRELKAKGVRDEGRGGRSEGRAK